MTTPDNPERDELERAHEETTRRLAELNRQREAARAEQEQERQRREREYATRRLAELREQIPVLIADIRRAPERVAEAVEIDPIGATLIDIIADVQTLKWLGEEAGSLAYTLGEAPPFSGTGGLPSSPTDVLNLLGEAVANVAKARTSHMLTDANEAREAYVLDNGRLPKPKPLTPAEARERQAHRDHEDALLRGFGGLSDDEVGALPEADRPEALERAAQVRKEAELKQWKHFHGAKSNPDRVMTFDVPPPEEAE